MTGQVPEPRQRPRGGSVWLGIVVGVVLFVLYLVASSLASPPAGGPPLIPVAAVPSSVLAGGSLWWIPLVGYLVLSVVLAPLPRTTRTGPGLLIAIGFWLLVGAGICVALLAGHGG